MQSKEINPALTARTLEGRMRHFETLLAQINAAVDPSTQAKVEEVIRVLMELHGAGLERMLDLVWESGLVGQELINAVFAQDELTSPLLLLHGLHPVSLEMRVNQALEKVRPYMHSHGGDVEIINVSDEGVVRLRLEGTCHGCPSSRVTLKFAVEKAIHEAAPDVVGIEVVGAAEPDTLAENTSTGNIPGNGPQNERTAAGEWVEAPGLASLQPGRVRIQTVVGTPILFCRVEDSLFAYGSQCPGCGQLLGQARLGGNILTCLECGHTFDIYRAGRDLDVPALHLAPFPLMEADGLVKVAV
jgi:Fe-S cluster biogenesis protein NfuA/nitrite reductase/ring-hydroxylating ferredoxin subunit